MTKSKIFLLAQSALCVLTAVLLGGSAIRIFLEGSAYQAAGHPAEWIYTREKAVAAIIPVLPLIAVSIAMTVYGLIRGIKDEEADKPVKDVELSRDLLCARVAVPSEEMNRERALQKKLKAGGWAVFGICMVPVLIYIASGNNFAEADAEGLERVIMSLLAHVAPWTAVGLAALVISTLLIEKSMQREADAASVRMKEEKADTAAGSAEQTAEEERPAAACPGFNKVGSERAKRRVMIRRILLIAAVCFIVMGIFNGSMKDVLVKAIKICTECVGLG